MRKRVIPIIASIMLLGGCWDTRNIDHAVYIHSIGIDYKDGQVIAYVQLIDFTALAKVEAGAAEKKRRFPSAKPLAKRLISRPTKSTLPFNKGCHGAM